MAASSLAPSAMLQAPHLRVERRRGRDAAHALEHLGERVVGLVGRVVVHEEKEAVASVRLEPAERVAGDLRRVACAIAMVGQAFEAHVDADGRVARHEEVVHERARDRAAPSQDQRQERRVGRVVPLGLAVREHPDCRVDPELARALAHVSIARVPGRVHAAADHACSK